jgi:hypothetical protein
MPLPLAGLVAPFFAGLWGSLQLILGSMIGKVLLNLGVVYYMYQGVDLLMDSIKVISFNTLQEAAGMSVAPQLSGLFGLMRLGEAFNVYFSAFMTSLTLKGLNSMGGAAIAKIGLK